MRKKDYYLNLNVDSYLKEWLEYHYGDPIVLPKDTPEVRIMRNFLRKKRNSDSDIESEDIGNIRILIPNFAGQDSKYYRYMGEKAKTAMVSSLKKLVDLNISKEVVSLKNINCSTQDLIRCWMEKHGISDIHENTIRIRVYRFKRRYAQSQIKI